MTTSANTVSSSHVLGNAFPVEKDAGKLAFQKPYEKPRDRNLEETHEVHEYEEAEDSAEAEGEDDEQNEVYLEDQGQSDEQEELDEDD